MLIKSLNAIVLEPIWNGWAMRTKQNRIKHELYFSVQNEL